MTSKDGFGLATASPLQLAIFRVIDHRSLGDLWDDAQVRAAFGGVLPSREVWDEILLLSGIRSGKSLIAAGAAVYSTQTCGFEPAPGVKLGPGEIPRVSVLSTKKDLASVVFNHILGNMQQSPYLSTLLMDDPKGDSVLVRHPNGRPVEIKVVAGSRAGSSLVARWSAGVVFDEAPRMQGQEEGVVNLEDMRAGVRFRLLSGARIWYIGSPWAPSGPTYTMKEENWGNAEAKVLVMKAPAQAMNPLLWTTEKVAAFREADPEIARTDLDAEFASPETNLFTEELLRLCARKEPRQLPYDPTCEYVAAMDPATRRNAWTLTIATRVSGKLRQVGAWEWLPRAGEHLSPKVVLGEIADICRTYAVYKLKSDQWAADAIRDIAAEFDLPYVQEDFHGATRSRAYLSLARRMEAGMVELAPNKEVQADLSRVKRRPQGDGSVKIVLPQTADGRHADHAPTLVAAMSEYMDDPMARPAVAPKPSPWDDEVIEEAEDRLFAAEVRGEDDDDDEWSEEGYDDDW